MTIIHIRHASNLMPWKKHFERFLIQDSNSQQSLTSFHPLAGIKHFMKTEFITLILKSILKALNVNTPNSNKFKKLLQSCQLTIKYFIAVLLETVKTLTQGCCYGQEHNCW